MTIEIDIKSQVPDKTARLSFVVQLLKSLDFVDFVRVKDDILDVPQPSSPNKLADLLLTGPTMTPQDEEYYHQKQQHFSAWK